MEVIQLGVRTPRPGSSGWDLVRAVIRLMTFGDLDQARRRMRFAWVAGFIWAGISLFNAGINALGLIFGFDAEGQPWWSGGQLAFVLFVQALVRSFRTLEIRWPRWAELFPGYAVGTLGAFWFIQRTVILFGWM